MKKIAIFSCGVLMLFLFGCSSFVEPLLKEEAMPEGKVLLIGKVNVSPHFGKVTKEEFDYIMMSLNDDLSRSVNSIDEAIDPPIGKVFYFPVSPGSKFFRVGQVMIAMQALAKMRFRGVGTKDVVKKLAVVLNTPSTL